MIDDGFLQELLKRALSHGGEYADIFIEHRETTSIQLEDDRIEKVISGSFSGLGIRLIYNGKTAYAFSNDFSKSVLSGLAATVSKAATDSERNIVMDMKQQRPGLVLSSKIPPASVPLDRKVALTRQGNMAARSMDTRIKQVNIIYRDSLQKVKMASSDGIIANDERSYTMGMAHVIAADGASIQTGYEAAGGLTGYELFDTYPMDTLAETAARRAVLLLGARKAPGGRMPVIISSAAGGTMIHEAIGHGLEADLARQGLSVYSNKLGQRVASPVVTVIDDATIPDKRGSFSVDDEGVQSQKNILVSEGILSGYMYDKYNAFIDKTNSTGNGRRESYEHKPIPRMTNTMIAPGNFSPEEVLRSVSSGLLVKKMGGGQVNTVTGDFVFDVQEGYLIENGRPGDPVRGATLVGNGPEVLLSIDMVASDLGFSIGTCGKDSQGVPVSDAMPTLRIPEMVVGGEVS
ncbi:MAG: TldD/PmbA family protein [Nitrospirae bacterium]|nr:TldD/PmbA family protein [Nitrospirota bacterium]